MKHLYTLLSFCLLIQLNAIAQRNFKPGYILNLKGDTTKGFINYKEWNQNPRDITFKTTEQSDPKQYSTNDILGFGIDNTEHYLRYSGRITTGAVDLADLSSGIDSSVVNESVFLRGVVKGKNIALYTYKDKIKARYFISEKNGAPVELRRYVYLDNNRSDKIQEYNFYMQQLLALAIKYQPGNDNLADQIQKLVYRSQDIEDVVLKIDGSTNQIKRSTASRSGIAFFAGLSANSFKTAVAGKDDFLGAAEPSKSILPGVNFGVDIFFNKNVGKIKFRAEVGLSANKVRLAKVTNQADYSTTYVRDDKLSFDQFTVSLTPQLIYNIFNKSNLKVYLSGGPQINFTTYNNYDRHLIEHLNNALIADTHKTDPYLRATYPGAIFKAGVVINNKFELYAGYSTRARLGNYNGKGYSFDVDAYRIGLNYLFGKK